jgi:hydrogenase-4 component E
MQVHDLSVAQALAGSVAVLLIVVQLGLFRTVVLAEMIRIYAVQSALVAVVCLVVAVSVGAWDLLILAILTFAVKAVWLPSYMRALARGVSTRIELPARINVLLSLMIASSLVGIAILTSARLPLRGGAFLPTADLATTLSIVFVGFLAAILRPNALAQVVAFLTLENGLFFGTVTLAPGLPLVIGILLLIDVVVAVVVFAMLVRVLVARHETASISVFQRLQG